MWKENRLEEIHNGIGRMQYLSSERRMREFACVDGLTGFDNAIEAVYLQTEIQHYHP